MNMIRKKDTCKPGALQEADRLSMLTGTSAKVTADEWKQRIAVEQAHAPIDGEDVEVVIHEPKPVHRGRHCGRARLKLYAARAPAGAIRL